MVPFRRAKVVSCICDVTKVVVCNAQAALQVHITWVLFCKTFSDLKRFHAVYFSSIVIIVFLSDITEIIVCDAQSALHCYIIRKHICKFYAYFKSHCIVYFCRVVVVSVIWNIPHLVIYDSQVVLHLWGIRKPFRKLFRNFKCRVCSGFRCGVIKHSSQCIAGISITSKGFMRMVRVSAVFAFCLKYLCIFKVQFRRSFMLPVIRIGFCEFFQCRGVFRGIRELFVFLLHSRTAQQA